MTNWDLENEAWRRRLPLVGIFNKDQLPATPRNGFYIINLQDDLDVYGNDLPGTHWTILYIEGKHAVYFDSFGFAPPYQVQNFLKPFIPYPYNTQVIQSMRSTVCGKYVLYFMIFMTRHRKRIVQLRRRFNAFLDLWNQDVSKNRERLLEFLSSSK